FGELQGENDAAAVPCFSSHWKPVAVPIAWNPMVALRAFWSTVTPEIFVFGRGRVAAMALPPWSTPTQRGSEAHETARKLQRKSAPTRCQSATPPVGLVDSSASPLSSTTTHRTGDGHEAP